MNDKNEFSMKKYVEMVREGKDYEEVSKELKKEDIPKELYSRAINRIEREYISVNANKQTNSTGISILVGSIVLITFGIFLLISTGKTGSRYVLPYGMLAIGVGGIFISINYLKKE